MSTWCWHSFVPSHLTVIAAQSHTTSKNCKIFITLLISIFVLLKIQCHDSKCQDAQYSFKITPPLDNWWNSISTLNAIYSFWASPQHCRPRQCQCCWKQRGFLDDTVQSVHACGEDVKVTKSFTHLSRVVHNDGGSYQEVTWIGLAHSVIDSLNTSIWHCRYLCRWTKV